MHIPTLILFLVIHLSCGSWVSEWLTPIQKEFKSVPDDFLKSSNEDKYISILPATTNVVKKPQDDASSQLFPADISVTLEATLEKSRNLINNLKQEIFSVAQRELRLKDVIANGWLGLTVATVTTMGRFPRSFIIRNGSWAICKGNIRYPNYNFVSLNWRSNVPKCSSEEATTDRDICIFNSIIKYQIVPSNRRSIYEEDDYVCQKNSFNNTIEKYLSVPPGVMKTTCGNDVSNRLSDILLECGARMVTEYKYYPYTRTQNIPLEYCSNNDGSCKLTVAWHLTNTSIEHMEFFEVDKKFKDYYLKQEAYTNI